MRLPREAWAQVSATGEIMQVVEADQGDEWLLVWHCRAGQWAMWHRSWLRGPARELAEALLAEVES